MADEAGVPYGRLRDEPAAQARRGLVYPVYAGSAGERVAYVRLFSGTLRLRDRLPAGRETAARVTAISVFDRGGAAPRGCVSAGRIARLWGLGHIRIGDAIGVPPPGVPRRHFAPPMMETVVVPGRAAGRGALRVALAQLAEQDPLINVRQDDAGQEIRVSLCGEMGFRETTTICIERLAGTGAAVEVIGVPPNPFRAGVGLRAPRPAPPATSAA